jgi:hypothetical protein
VPSWRRRRTSAPPTRPGTSPLCGRSLTSPVAVAHDVNDVDSILARLAAGRDRLRESTAN